MEHKYLVAVSSESGYCDMFTLSAVSESAVIRYVNKHYYYQHCIDTITIVPQF